MQHAPQIPVLEVDLGPGIRAFFTTRAGGVSRAPWASLNVGTSVGDDPAHVSRNRELVDQAAGARVTFVSQVHGRAVAVLPGSGSPGVPSAPALGASTEADALVSRAVDAPVGVYVADCVPVLLADPSSGVVAAVHAGRPGVELGVVGEAVRAMVATGADIASICAAVGPSVCGRCYEVPADLRERVAAAVPATGATTSWGTPGLDLPRGVLAQLADAGVTQVVHVERCTRTDDAFFSHRRASADGLVTGRFAGVVGARRSQT
ncbi:peptidoglycan editing factor PgeF [Sanguibacter sp. Leaf3]|uniref:peptidoglycan editing factor PgeF n=1 Tax=Sanguibacter sp. Leaf3 TaxID=1736209 RepID=UPI000700295E|nr:peptidoglycan editing factor PgeF [Sanguibacter sp. Leaf3]KQU00547.1 multicopper polyphenol oxidase [Sanguibacter sp. Leaf3]